MMPKAQAKEKGGEKYIIKIKNPVLKDTIKKEKRTGENVCK